MKRMARFLVPLTIAVAFTVPASSAPRLLVCEAVGVLNYGELTAGEETPIDIHGSGTCAGDFAGPYTLRLDGAGLGGANIVCSFPFSGGGLAVNLTLTSVRTGATSTIVQSWQLLAAPPGTVMAVAILGPGGRGAGAIVTRLFNAVTCLSTDPADQSPAVFAFAFLR